jgi:hypothetical protein
MISQDDIDAFRGGNLTDSVYKDIERALMGVKTAIHYMAETGHIESKELDGIADELMATKFRIERLLNDH